jgi:hypothetical protein
LEDGLEETAAAPPSDDPTLAAAVAAVATASTVPLGGAVATLVACDPGVTTTTEA